MEDIVQWEYRVQSFGTIWRSLSDEDLEAILDDWGADGWEVLSCYQAQGSNKVRVIARRHLAAARKRRRNWPEA